MAKQIIVNLFLILSVASYSRADLVGLPMNDVVLQGTDTVVLSCEATATARVLWTEFVTNPNGLTLSDSRIIIQSHPNAARYAIIGTGTIYNLQISNISLADGGKYLCQDINGSPPATFRGSADLTVLESDPVCEGLSTLFGTVMEGRYYSTECEVRYQGAFTPNMTWTGPGNFDSSNSVTETEVWHIASFTATRDIEGGRFESHTQFFLPPVLPDEGARNIPDYQYTYIGMTLVVNWPPQNLQVVPVEEIYQVGDTITCSADSKPNSTYRWTNIRTQVTNPAGAVFTITEDMQGYTNTLRCNAIVMLEGSLYTNDIFINATVPAVTSATSPPTSVSTTQPLADGPCNDLSGHWSSTNPNSHLCIEMDGKGNLLILIRNGSDPFFVAGNGKTVYGDFKHVGFTGVWPVGLGGVGGFTGECHNCFGDEVILLSGLYRDKADAPECGASAGTHLTNLYVMTRYGPPCRDVNDAVFNPTAAHIKHMGIKPEKIMRSSAAIKR